MDLSGQQNGVFGSVLHPLWLSSGGVGLLVDKGIPLHISMNSSMMCLSAMPPQLDCGSKVRVETALNYTICAFDTIANTAKFFLNSSELVTTPTALPDEILFQSPLWTVSSESADTQITEEMIEECEKIVSFNLFSQIELGEVNSLSFQNSVMNSFDGMNVFTRSPCSRARTSLWVHPYVNYNWNDFKIGLQNDFYLPGPGNGDEGTVSLVRWSGDFGAVTNFFSAPAESNFKLRLLSLIHI